MDATNSDGARPGGDDPRRDAAARPVDVLDTVASTLTEIEASAAARVVLAQLLTATLTAFTRTGSVRDPLPETAPGSPQEALSVLAGLDHLRSSLSAMDAAWQVTAEQRIRRADEQRGVPAAAQGRGANNEIALARRVSPAASSFSLASARRLVQHMPGTVDALWEAAVTAQQASTVAGALSTASPETCRRIDELIRTSPLTLHGKGHKRLRSEIDEMVLRLEPETSRERAERAARGRHLSMTPLADGMARVSAVLRGIDAVGMMSVLQAEAESLRAAGAKIAVPALEADLLVDAVLARREGTAPSGTAPAAEAMSTEDAARTSSAANAPDAIEGTVAAEELEATAPSEPPRRPRTTPGIEIGIVITERALFDRDDEAESAHLEGYGSIPAHIVRDTLLGRPPGHLRHDEGDHPDEEVSAFFRRLYVTPRTGDLVGMESRARAFPAGLARMIRWRDSTCRTPWCNARIRHSDHVVPYHRGGPTSYANGQGLCVRCNLLKEHGLWLLEVLTGEASSASVSTASGETSESAQAPGSADAPPAAWVWTSPHGARGISWRPPLLDSATSTAQEPPSSEADEPPAGSPPEADPPPAPPPA